MFKDTYFDRKQGHSNTHSFIKSASRCAICNEFGHISSQCFKALKKCIYCCDSSHSFSKCPETLCHLCNLPGHSLRTCTYPSRCILCNIAGHNDSNCISMLKPSHIGDCDQVTCLNCRGKGHANCAEFKANFNLYSKTCSACGQTGHPFSQCPQNKRDKKANLFRQHVKQALTKLPEFSRKLNKNERRYWEKVKNKAFKKAFKKRKLKKKKAVVNK